MIPDLDEVLGHIKASIAKPSARDKQVKLGASEIGDPCFFCTGYKIARKFFDLPPRRESSFGYAAWVGTMCHKWLEDNLEQPVPTLREHRVPIFDLDGYGTIYGTADIVWPDWKRVGDWKWPGEYSYEKVKLARAKNPVNWAPTVYRYQQQALAFGLNNAGIEIEWCSIFFLPRHTNALDSVIAYEESYTPEMVYLAKVRLEAIIEDVLEGRLGDLPSDSDCFECSSFQGSGRPDVSGYINHELERQGANQ